MTAFDDEGAGPAVVLLHGHPFDRSLWTSQRHALVAAGFRVVAPDLRGYGESAATAGTVLMRELAGDVLVLLERLEVAHAAVVGLSMGGLVAMELAIAQPELVWALGLIATTAEPVRAAERQQRRDLADAVEREGMAPLVRSMRKGLYGPQAPPELIERIDHMMLENNPIGAAAALRGRARRPDYRDGLRALGIPSFVCAGDADPWSTAAVTRQLLDCLQRPRTLILDGVGHLPNLEALDRFNQELISFLHTAARHAH